MNKKSDAIILGSLAVIGVVLAFIVTYSLVNPAFRSTEIVPAATAVDSTITEPSSRIFNKTAINPTVEVIIGDGGGR